MNMFREPRPAAVEIKRIEEDRSLDDRVEAFLKRYLYQAGERKGLLEPGNPIYDVVSRITERLYSQFDVDRAAPVVVDSAEVNAFVAIGRPEVYTSTGLMRAMLFWGERHEIEVSEDMIAFVVAHELTHVDQGTAEKSGEREQSHSAQDRINAEYDADRGALLAMAMSGYNPREGLKTMDFLQGIGGALMATTHPRSPDRYRELLDLVESPDTFLPNVNTAPTALSEAVITEMKNGRNGSPGTRLYREEGRAQIGEILEQCDTIVDAFEVAGMAHEYDVMAAAEQAIRLPEVKKMFAQGIALYNIGAVLDALGTQLRTIEYHQIARSGYSAPEVPIRYARGEFQLSAFDSSLIAPETIDESSQLHTVREQNRDRLISSIRSDIKLHIQKYEEAHERSFWNADRFAQLSSDERRSIMEHRTHLESGLAVLKEILERFDTILDAVNSESLESFIESAEVEGEPTTDWANMIGNMNWVREQNVDDLIQWCCTNGTPFFHDELLDNLPLKDSRFNKLIYVEDRKDTYFEDRTFFLPDLTTTEGRTQYSKASLFQSEMYIAKHVHSSFLRHAQLSSSAGMPIEKFEGTARSQPHVEKTVDGLRSMIQGEMTEYLSTGAAERYALFMSEHACRVDSIGYDPSKMQELIQSFSLEECTELLRVLPRPEKVVTSSAESLFSSETGMQANDYVIRNMNFFEVELCRRVRDRVAEEGQGRIPPNRELERIGEILALSSEKMVELLAPDIKRCVLEATYQTAEELQTAVRPILDSLQGYTRKKILEDIIVQARIQLPPVEVIRFLEGESPQTLWKIFYTYWNDETAFADPKERLAFLETLFTLSYQWTRHSDPRGSKVSQGMQHIGKEYLDLYTEVHGDETVAVAYRQLADAGLIGAYQEPTKGLGNIQTFFMGDPIAHEMLFAPENRETLYALARYCTKQFASMKPVQFNKGLFRKEENPARDFFTQHCSKALIQDFNNSSQRPDVLFAADDRTIQQQFVFLKQHVPAPFRNTLLDRALKEYNLSPNEVVESTHRWPGGLVSELDSIPESEKKLHLPSFPRGLDLPANSYSADAPSIFERQKQRYWKNSRAKWLRRYLDQSTLISDASRTEVDRVVAIKDLIPETSQFRDEVFEEIESTLLAERQWQVQGVDISPLQEDSSMEKNEVRRLYAFYEDTIPHIFDTGLQQLWSRKAEQLFEQYLQPEKESFDDAFHRILRLYPHASHARDEALQALGDSPRVKTLSQARAVTSQYFQALRRTTDKKELTHMSVLEYTQNALSHANRSQRKEFILWTIGVSSQPPLVARALGGDRGRSVEDVPAALFGATQAERYELFLRLLQGDNGVLDPRNAEDEVVMTEILMETFNVVFPVDVEMDQNMRDVVQLIYTTVFQEYSPYRRSQVFIRVMEVIKDQSVQTPGARLRSLLEVLGPVAIKAGQVLSEEEIRPGEYLLDDDMRSEMSQLKQNADTFHRTAAFQSLESVGEFDTGREPHVMEVRKRLAAASIKQVYVVALSDGTTAVDKVRRPSIGKHLEEDMRVLEQVVDALGKQYAVPKGMSQRIRRWLTEESDFTHEVENHHAVDAVLREYESRKMVGVMPVRVPEIYTHSAEHIREEYIRGISLEELMRLSEGSLSIEKVQEKHGFDDADAADYAQLMERLDDVRLQASEALLYQMFVAGVFHSDAHAGNIILSTRGELVFIDVGSAGKIETEQVGTLRDFFIGLLRGKKNVVEKSIENFVPQLSHMQRDEIGEVCAQETRIDEKLAAILTIISDEGQEIDSGFENFLKGLGTGAYLMRDLESRLLPSLLRFSLG
jgi:predicted unusual protein kinase regulating ubiquinone biosynthesis (AarF/ABC1/UbiB family)